jgi:hypothetical protein
LGVLFVVLLSQFTLDQADWAAPALTGAESRRRRRERR